MSNKDKWKELIEFWKNNALLGRVYVKISNKIKRSERRQKTK
jgi:hypothetical protein